MQYRIQNKNFSLPNLKNCYIIHQFQLIPHEFCGGKVTSRKRGISITGKESEYA